MKEFLLQLFAYILTICTGLLMLLFVFCLLAKHSGGVPIISIQPDGVKLGIEVRF